MNNKIWEITWVDGNQSIVEGISHIDGITNHFGEFYQQFYLSHKEIPYEKNI